MINVKTPNKEWRLNCKFKQPLILDDNELRRFLNHFSDRLSTWAEVKNPSGKLPRETLSALMHTTHALKEISEYCLNELGAKFFLLGRFQTNSLKTRFRQYRQLAGGKYHVSLHQVY